MYLSYVSDKLSGYQLLIPLHPWCMPTENQLICPGVLENKAKKFVCASPLVPKARAFGHMRARARKEAGRQVWHSGQFGPAEAGSRLMLSKLNFPVACLGKAAHAFPKDTLARTVEALFFKSAFAHTDQTRPSMFCCICFSCVWSKNSKMDKKSWNYHAWQMWPQLRFQEKSAPSVCNWKNKSVPTEKLWPRKIWGFMWMCGNKKKILRETSVFYDEIIIVIIYKI